MTTSEYPVIIIGGGIVGAGCFRDLSLHGIPTLLLDKGDFSAQTSSRSSKMLHGGIRYLENFEFSLVKEALKEKNLWLKMAPHLCKEQPFNIPIYTDSKNKLWEIALGLKLYDFLSGYGNSPHKVLSSKKVLEKHPYLKAKGLKGAGVYYDAIVDDVQLTLDCIFDGLSHTASEALNYKEVLTVGHSQGRYQIQVRDTLNEKTETYFGKQIIFCLGPFTDKVLSNILPKWEPVLAPSKGIHLWLKKDALPLEQAMVLMSKDGRVVFVIPYEQKILVGTTETKPEKDFFNISATQKEIDYLIDLCSDYFPSHPIKQSDILSSYAGVRPLVKEPGEGQLGQLSREHRIFQPQDNMHVIAGGKYTTFRTMVQEPVKNICLKHGISYNPNKTIQPFISKCHIDTMSRKKLTPDDIRYIIEFEKVRTFSDLYQRRLGYPSKEHWDQTEDFESFFKDIIKDSRLPTIETTKN